MIYLILNMFVYLLLALLLGAAAGWLIRNLAATRREDELQKVVTESRARVPQFESLMRSRDEQVQRLRDELKNKEQSLAEVSGQLHGKDEEIRGKQRELGALNARNQALEGLPSAVDDAATLDMDVLDLTSGTDSVGKNSKEADLRAQIQGLNRELAAANAALADAVAEAAAAEAELVGVKAQLRRASAAVTSAAGDRQGDVQELEARLRQKAQEQERLARTLETEQRKVVELERERELQNKSLQVLHQQLELERERNGQVQSDGRSDAIQAARH